MKKNIIVTGLLALALGAMSVNAKELDLRSNMLKLNAELNEVQRGFINGDIKQINSALEALEKDSQEFLNHKEKMMEKLPADVTHKRHKVNKSMKAARDIKNNIYTIRKALSANNGLSEKRSRAKAQEAYLNIVNSCFVCHNQVRDAKRAKLK
ncbi:MAG: hypothetical protein U9Q40_11915 [Campylobacterota bacterium]|nr:hypothetical protein [Campylobacterota bacterium]